MGGEVEPVAREIHRQADRLVDDVSGGEEQERRTAPGHVVSNLTWLMMRQHEPMRMTVVR